MHRRKDINMIVQCIEEEKTHKELMLTILINIIAFAQKFLH